MACSRTPKWMLRAGEGVGSLGGVADRAEPVEDRRGVRPGQVRRAADQVRRRLGEALERDLAVACGSRRRRPSRPSHEARQQVLGQTARACGVPRLRRAAGSRGASAASAVVASGALRRASRPRARGSRRARRRGRRNSASAASRARSFACAHVVGAERRRRGPSTCPPVGAAAADRGAGDDQRRPVGSARAASSAASTRLHVLAVHLLDVPALRLEAPRRRPPMKRRDVGPSIVMWLSS